MPILFVVLGLLVAGVCVLFAAVIYHSTHSDQGWRQIRPQPGQPVVIDAKVIRRIDQPLHPVPGGDDW